MRTGHQSFIARPRLSYGGIVSNPARQSSVHTDQRFRFGHQSKILRLWKKLSYVEARHEGLLRNLFLSKHSPQYATPRLLPYPLILPVAFSIGQSTPSA